MSTPAAPTIIRLGRTPYEPVVAAMRAYAQQRQADARDEIWLLEHEPVFTLGQSGRPEHVLSPGSTPVVRTDRGGQVTYHGPGQVVAYPLIDLRRLHIYVKEYVYRLEQAAIQTLDGYGIAGLRVAGAPGVYVRLDDPGAGLPAGPRRGPFDGLAKIAALGVKVTRHCTYHGIALNVAMDLTPFRAIDPCGHAGLQVTDLATLGITTDSATAAERLGARLAAHLSTR